jgi:hypothetical protein
MFATRRRLMLTIVTIAAVVVVSLLSLGVYVWLKIWPEYGEVARLRTPAWEYRGFDGYSTPLLMLRRETQAGGALLLKRTGLETVYRYDPPSRSIRAVTDAEWQNAGGPIAKCLDQGRPAGLRRDDREHKLFAGDREIPTAGGVAIDEKRSPSGKWVAVHSAAGPVEKSIIPDGSYVIFGQRYHEILSLPDFVRDGNPVRIPATENRGTMQPCWSADEKFVVYSDDAFWMVAVVETGF